MRYRIVSTVRAHLSGWLARRTLFLFGFCNAVNYLFVSFFLIANIFMDFFSDTGNSFLSSLKVRDYACRSYKRIHLKEYTCM